MKPPRTKKTVDGNRNELESITDPMLWYRASMIRSCCAG